MRNEEKITKAIIFYIFLILFFLSPAIIAETITYTYDAAGRLTKVDYGSGESIAYTYDAMGNILSCKISAGIDIDIRPGWNDLALAHDPGPLTAEGLCIQITDQGGTCEEIYHFVYGGWEGHICGNPLLNNFSIQPGHGYLIKSTSTSTWRQEGDDIPSPLQIDLHVGWNSISIPNWAEGYFDAQGLIDAINDQGGCCEELDRFYAGGWQGHINHVPIYNFPILPGDTYIVKCSCESQFELERK